MAVISGSVEVDVPIAFADREWTEFVFRNQDYETEADSGTVKLETEGERLVRVSVELEYKPSAGTDPSQEVAQAQARLDRDLERYRKFLLKRCEQEDCRTN